MTFISGSNTLYLHKIAFHKINALVCEELTEGLHTHV